MFTVLRFSLALGFVLSLCFHVGTANAQAQKNSDKSLQDYLRNVNVDFVIKGKVVDQDGKPLQNVKLDIHRMNTPAPFMEKKYDEQKTINEFFDLTYSYTYSVTLFFRLDGYHSRTINFSSANLQGKARIDGHTHIYDNLIVVLQKIGKLAQLDRYDLFLSSTPGGKLKVWDLSTVGPERVEGRILDFNTVPGPEIPGVFVHIVPSEAPIMPIMRGEREATPKNGVVQLVLQDGKGGGFVRAYPKGKTMMETILEITTAPTEGYTSTLNLSALDVANTGSNHIVYFYFKINGLFGKGYINDIFYRPDVGVKQFSIIFLLQPDGSTNVETTSW